LFAASKFLTEVSHTKNHWHSQDFFPLSQFIWQKHTTFRKRLPKCCVLLNNMTKHNSWWMSMILIKENAW